MSEKEPMDSIFYDYHKPDMANGEYCLKVSITGRGIDKLRVPEQVDVVEQSLFISGQRFNFPASVFHSCYPPEFGEGDFSQCMPHLVFNKSTLPWEWPTPIKETDFPIPWMALVLFHEAEIPKTKPVKIGELLSGWKNNYQPSVGEDSESECLCIELSCSFFEKVMPLPSELPYLFHVKASGDAKYAVAMANRLPKIGKNEVHLVSLLGWDANEKCENIKLVTLKKWSFTSKEGKKGNLSNLMSQVKCGSYRNKAFFGSKDVPANLQELLTQRGNQAYNLLSFRKTDGSTDPIWYRGPFIPFLKEKDDNKLVFRAIIIERENLGDDISYATAWQLGQLLALKDKNFIQNLQNWKQTILANADGKTANNQLTGILKSLVETPLLNAMPKHVPLSVSDSECELYEGFIINWLSDLSLLRGVPFYYLVPSYQLLEKGGAGELAYFYLDPEWIENLLSGALSFIFMGSTQLLPELLKQTNRLFSRFKYSTVSGFILQSSVVTDWPDLDVDVLLKDKKLTEVRKEKLNPDILLCLYNGSYDSISFTEPFQALHFGFESEGTRKVQGSAITRTFRDPESFVLDVKSIVKDIAEAIKSPKEPKMCPAAFAFNMVNGADKIIFTK